MAKITQVLIVEPDPYARDWMALLLARDLRTRVVAEAEGPDQAARELRKSGLQVNLVILGVDHNGPDALGLPEGAAAARPGCGLLLIGGQVEARAAQWLANSPASSPVRNPAINGYQPRGYVLKDEISNSLAWAASLAAEGSFVVTPGVEDLAAAQGLRLPKPRLSLDGRQTVAALTPHQARAARLAFIYSMERRDLADELAVSSEWAYGLVSSLYEKLGLKDLLAEDLEPGDYLGSHPLILEHFEKIRREFQGRGKSRDMETLAFQLLTLPEVQEL